MFLGSGTTIVEANCMMRNCIGVDINPLACKISSAKTTIMTKSDIIKIQQILDQISTHIKKSNGFDHDKYIEKYVDVRVQHNWFQENILKELVIMKKIIDGIENLKIRNFMFVGFSAILRSVSDTASGFGNLMISKNPPKKKNAFKRYSFVNELKSKKIITKIDPELNIDMYVKSTKFLIKSIGYDCIQKTAPRDYVVFYFHDTINSMPTITFGSDLCKNNEITQLFNIS